VLVVDVAERSVSSEISVGAKPNEIVWLAPSDLALGFTVGDLCPALFGGLLAGVPGELSRQCFELPMRPMRTSTRSGFMEISAGVALALAVFAACKSKEPAAEPQTPPPGANQAEVPVTAAAAPVRVEVGSDGFQPTTVTLGAGRQIVFRRTSDSTCATAVVFPDLAIEKQLPLNTDVVIDLPASARGEIGFQCGMAMYKSKVVAQ